MLQTVDKAGQILNLFTIERPEWGVSEVAEVLSFPKSSTSVLVSTLAEKGLLRRTRSRRYRLGWRVLALSQVLLKTTDFHAKARQEMEYLSARYGEAVELGVLESNQLVLLERIRGAKEFGTTAALSNTKMPAHHCALGKIMLAYRAWEEVVESIDRRAMLGKDPIATAFLDDLRDELEDARRQGYACEVQGGTTDRCQVAAPIRDRNGEVAAAMGFSVPISRFELGKERYAVAILQSARTVSECLGCFDGRQATKAAGAKESKILQMAG